MPITIKKNDAPKLPRCEMLCDKGLHDKLNKYDLTKFLNNHSTTLLIGRPGSGKTSLLYSLFKKQFFTSLKTKAIMSFRSLRRPEGKTNLA